MSRIKPKIFKILASIIGVLIFLILLFNITFYYVLHSTLPESLAKNDLDYSITYSDLKISFFTREISLKDVKINPVDTTLSDRSGIYATINQIKLYDVSLLHVLSTNQIVIGGLDIDQPNIRLYPLKKQSGKIKKQFDKILKLDVFNMNNGNLQVYKNHGKLPFFYLNNFNFKLNGIGITPEGLKEKIPFTFSDYDITADSFQFNMNQFYTITAGYLKTDYTSVKLNDIKLRPNYSKANFLKHVSHQVDIYDVAIHDVKLDSINWGYNADKELFVAISTASLNRINAHISRDKSLPPDLHDKPLYSKMLRDIPFFLNVKNINILNSNIVYDEEQDLKPLYGTINFADFNASIKNLASGFKQTELPNVDINVNCKFYGVAPLQVHWDFNVLNRDDKFNISGILKNLPANRVDKFIQPSFNVTTQGNFKELKFIYEGNNEFAKGEFEIDYSELQVTFLKKDGNKNHFLSFVGNLLVRKDTDDKFKRTHVKFDRIQNKSFFNLVWKTTAQGLEHTLLVI